MAMTQLGLITTVLEEEVKRELRQRGIIIWLGDISPT